MAEKNIWIVRRHKERDAKQSKGLSSTINPYQTNMNKVNNQLTQANTSNQITQVHANKSRSFYNKAASTTK